MGFIFLSEVPSKMTLVGMAVGIGGILCVTRPTFLGFHGEGTMEPIAAALALGAAMVGGLAFVVIRHLREVDVLVLLSSTFGAQALFGFAASWFVCGVFSSTPRFSFSVSETLGMVTVGTTAFFGQQAMTLGAQRERAAVASAIRTLDVPLSYMVQINLFRQERLSILGVLGSALVCSSVLLLVVEKFYSESDNFDTNARAVKGKTVAASSSQPTCLGQSEAAVNAAQKPAAQETVGEAGKLLKQVA